MKLQVTMFILSNAISCVLLTENNECKKNYYGYHCMKYCVDRNDDGGHYTCDRSTGNIVCMHGWSNTAVNCTQRNDVASNKQSNSKLPSLTGKSISQLSIATTTFSGNVSEPINITVKLRGDFQCQENYFYSTFCKAVSTKMNENCGCSQNGSNITLSLEDKTFNSSYFGSKIVLKTGNQTCNGQFTSCYTKVLVESPSLLPSFKISFIQVSVDGKVYEHNVHPTVKTPYSKKTVIVIGTIFAALVIFVALAYVIHRFRRRSARANMIGFSMDQRI